METVTVVLNVASQHVEAFEAGFRQHEVPVWQDLHERGLLIGATLNRLDISSRPVEGSVQYLVAAIFATGEGHHAHDSHPGFEAWNKIADAYQIGDPMAFGGETVVQLGIASEGIRLAHRQTSAATVARVASCIRAASSGVSPIAVSPNRPSIARPDSMWSTTPVPVSGSNWRPASATAPMTAAGDRPSQAGSTRLSVAL